jgi:pilus assembly protein CpaB
MDRQRIIFLFGAAALLAGVLSWFLYANTVAPHAESRVAVMAAVHDMPVGQIFRNGDVKKVMVLQRDLPKSAVTSEQGALGRVALYPINANAPLTGNALSLLTGAEGIPATIPQGYRAVAVTITDVSGVAGLIQPGAHVDVLFTRPGTMAEAITSTILQNVKVLSIGRAAPTGQVVDLKAPRSPVATLVVTPEDVQKLELAKNEGRISLSLRNPLDLTAGVDGKPVNTDVLDPSMRGKVTLTKLRNSSTDPKAWESLTAEKKPLVPVIVAKPAPPPPPRAVVDVFRGDKHVQEVFHD